MNQKVKIYELGQVSKISIMSCVLKLFQKDLSVFALVSLLKLVTSSGAY